MPEVRNALSQALADGRYLRLDASNDPITENLELTKHIGLGGTSSTSAHGLIMSELFSPLLSPGTVVGLGCFPSWSPAFAGSNTIVSIQGNVWFDGTQWGAGSGVRGLDFFPAPVSSGIGSANLNITGITTGGMLNVGTRVVTANTITGIAVVPLAGFYGTDNSTVNIVRGMIISSAVSTLGTWGRLCGLEINPQTSGVINQGLWMAGDGIGADLLFGAGAGGVGDAHIYYDGTDLIIDPQLLGTGAVNILGDLIFTGDNTGLPFGEIYVKNNSNTMSVSSAGYTQVTDFAVNGESNNTTPDHNSDHITIIESGRYIVTVSMAILNSAGAGHTIDVHVSKNNDTTVFANLEAQRTLSAGTDAGSGSISGIIDINATDTLEVWISSDSGVARNITVIDITLTLVMLGGT